MENDNSNNQLSSEKIIQLMTFYPTLAETACWFKCSEDSIDRFIKTLGWNTFKEFRIHYSGKTRLLLKRKAITAALEEDNEKMLLYCLRAMTDMDDREKLADKEPVVNTIRLCYSDQFL